MDVHELSRFNENNRPNDYYKSIWNFLHRFSFMYPENPTEEDKINARNLFKSIGNITVLECAKCVGHFKYHLDNTLDNSLTDKDTLSQWLVDVHNEVNARQGKKFFPYQEAVKLYSMPMKVSHCDVSALVNKNNTTTKNTDNDICPISDANIDEIIDKSHNSNPTTQQQQQSKTSKTTENNDSKDVKLIVGVSVAALLTIALINKLESNKKKI